MIEQCIISRWEDLIKLEADWNRLFQHDKLNNPFVHFEWVSRWWHYFGAELELHTVVYAVQQRIVGIAPLMIAQEGGRRTIMLVGSPQANFLDLLFEEGYREACLKRLVAYLRDSQRWRLVDLQELRDDSPNYPVLMDLMQRGKIPFFTTKVDSYYIDLTDKDFESHLKNRSRKHHSIDNIKRSTNKIKRLGRLSYRVLETAELEPIFALHDKRWMRKLDTSGFSDPDSREFFKELTTLRQENFKAQVTGLWLDRRLLGFGYLMQCNGRQMLYRVAHDDDFRVYGPGKIMVQESIRACFADGLQIYDFGYGFEPYKAEWTDTKIALNRIAFPTRGWKARLAFAKWRWLETSLHPLKHNPALVRLKRDSLGQLRYWVATYFRRQFLPKYGWWGAVRFLLRWFKAWLWNREVRTVVKREVVAEPGIGGEYCLRPATLDDLPFLAGLMELETAEIVRRFYKNDQFLLLYRNQQFCGGGWVSFSRLTVPEWQYALPLEKGEAELYEFYSSGETIGQADGDFALFIRYLMNYLRQQKVLQLYLGLNPPGNCGVLNKEAEGFRPELRLIRLIRFGRVKYCSSRLTARDGGSIDGSQRHGV